uniref:Mucin-19-like n=1 Tax=Geotrypetes seraphini TaxID=260995 RepID=A0A6P8S9R5_GEOSA|nr:mucin-19-like [Geotrypetes seraphini]
MYQVNKNQVTIPTMYQVNKNQMKKEKIHQIRMETEIQVNKNQMEKRTVHQVNKNQKEKRTDHQIKKEKNHQKKKAALHQEKATVHKMRIESKMQKEKRTVHQVNKNQKEKRTDHQIKKEKNHQKKKAALHQEKATVHKMRIESKMQVNKNQKEKRTDHQIKKEKKSSEEESSTSSGESNSSQDEDRIKNAEGKKNSTSGEQKPEGKKNRSSDKKGKKSSEEESSTSSGENNSTQEKLAFAGTNGRYEGTNETVTSAGTTGRYEGTNETVTSAGTTGRYEGTNETVTSAGTTETVTSAGTTETVTSAGTTETVTSAGTTETVTSAGTTVTSAGTTVTSAGTTVTSEGGTGDCTIWSSGSFENFNRDAYYFEMIGRYTFCHETSDESFNVETMMEPGKLKATLIEMCGSEIKYNTHEIVVDNNAVTVPYQNDLIRITMCGLFTLVSCKSAGIEIRLMSDKLAKINLLQPYNTEGICGCAGKSQGKITQEELMKNQIEEQNNSSVIYMGTDKPCNNGTEFCSNMIDKYFRCCTPSTDDYINICANAYCRGNGISSVNPTFVQLATKCAEQSLSTCPPSTWCSWENDANVVRENYTCPSNQVFSFCARTPTPTCSNPFPFKGTEVTACCTCPSELVVNDIDKTGNCIKQEDCPCRKNGAVYQSGQQRQERFNSTCTCSGGKWFCTPKMSESICRVGYNLIVTTFDGNTYPILKCGSFVIYKNENITVLNHIETNSNHLLVSGMTLIINSDLSTRYHVPANCQPSCNTQPIRETYHSDANVQICSVMNEFVEIRSKNAIIDLKCDNTHMLINIRLPQNMGNNSQGLCGSSDGDASNDFRSPQNIMESTPVPFIETWRLGSSKCSSPPPSCVNLENELFAVNNCKLMESGEYMKCHSIVDVYQHIERCKLATCISTSPRATVCRAFEAFVEECADNGITLKDWRNDICKQHCNINQTFQYNINPFRTSCRSITFQSEFSECKAKTDGCACSDNHYLNNNNICVPQNQCECYMNNTIVNPGESIQVMDKQCTCTDGTLKCETRQNTTLSCQDGEEYYNCDDPSRLKEDMTCLNYNLPSDETGPCEAGCRCPKNMVRNSNKICVLPSQCPCRYEGLEYSNGETTKVDCNECLCSNGTWQCTENKCSSTCTTYGNGHINTFDRAKYQFAGPCSYTFITDQCGQSSGSFQIAIQYEKYCEGGNTRELKMDITTAEGITVTMKSGKFTVTSTNSTCNDTDFIMHNINIKTVGMMTTLKMNGITVMTDKQTMLVAKAHPSHIGNICGLCGNFNGNSRDDFTTRQQSEAGALECGNSWKTSSNCNDALFETHPCKRNPYCAEQAKKNCFLLKSKTFSDCHLKVDVTFYYDSCMRDACACDIKNGNSGFCSVVSAYAHACNTMGVCTNWRSAQVCPIACQYYNENGQCIWDYKSCGTITSKTCNDQYVGQKLNFLVEGCFARCPANAPYLDTNAMKCVPRSQCTCFHRTVMNAGDTMTECGKTYVCENGKLIPQASTTTLPTTTTASTTTLPTTTTG